MAISLPLSTDSAFYWQAVTIAVDADDCCDVIAVDAVLESADGENSR
jgi:hypothetical protein